MNDHYFEKWLSFMFVLLLSSTTFAFSAKNQSHCIGADISWVQQQEDKGLKYSDDGRQEDVLTILKTNGFNWIRLRLFVDPKAEKGYSKDGYCDLEHTIVMAKRIKALGMNLLLDFHYSDTWADPGKQFMPSSWSGLKGAALEEKLYTYTKDVLERFRNEGVIPQMVQVGNEINHGMMWPEGKADSSLIPLSALLRRAIEAVRSVDPKIKIMIHIACGGQNKESIWFFDQIQTRGVEFDIIGQSYYPEYHGTLDDLKSNLTDLIVRYHKPIVIVEYQVLRQEVNEIVLNLPDKMGMGTFIWEATSPRWGHLFDKDGNATEELKLYPEIAKKFKNRR